MTSRPLRSSSSSLASRDRRRCSSRLFCVTGVPLPRQQQHQQSVTYKSSYHRDVGFNPRLHRHRLTTALQHHGDDVIVIASHTPHASRARVSISPDCEQEASIFRDDLRGSDTEQRAGCGDGETSLGEGQCFSTGSSHLTPATQSDPVTSHAHCERRVSRLTVMLRGASTSHPAVRPVESDQPTPLIESQVGGGCAVVSNYCSDRSKTSCGEAVVRPDACLASMSVWIEDRRGGGSGSGGRKVSGGDDGTRSPQTSAEGLSEESTISSSRGLADGADSSARPALPQLDASSCSSAKVLHAADSARLSQPSPHPRSTARVTSAGVQPSRSECTLTHATTVAAGCGVHQPHQLQLAVGAETIVCLPNLSATAQATAVHTSQLKATTTTTATQLCASVLPAANTFSRNSHKLQLEPCDFARVSTPTQRRHSVQRSASFADNFHRIFSSVRDVTSQPQQQHQRKCGLQRAHSFSTSSEHRATGTGSERHAHLQRRLSVVRQRLQRMAEASSSLMVRIDVSLRYFFLLRFVWFGSPIIFRFFISWFSHANCRSALGL